MKRLCEVTAVCFLIFVILALGCTGVGIGGTDANITPSADIKTELELVKKEVDNSKTQLKDITGDVSLFEQRMTNIQTDISTINQQLTQNIQYNESIKSIAWTVAGIYMALKVLEFFRALIIAKVAPGSTLMNLVKGNKK